MAVSNCTNEDTTYKVEKGGGGNAPDQYSAASMGGVTVAEGRLGPRQYAEVPLLQGFEVTFMVGTSSVSKTVEKDGAQIMLVPNPFHREELDLVA